MTHRSTPHWRRFALTMTCLLVIFSGLGGVVNTTQAQTRAYVTNINADKVSVANAG